MSVTQTLVAKWIGEHHFEAGRPGRPAALIDGDGKSAPSPVDILLASIGTCGAVDVVDILAKRRTPVESLEVEVIAKRVETIPRHLEHVMLIFRIAGEGIERVHAERAVELSVSKYCSVASSIRPDVPIEWKVELQSDAIEERGHMRIQD
ncbi:MAG TPA: OsmC family protein [Gemmatimonadaceae bacterium]|nr:OsmC family protein [Gemmatimonadaceae bacterium]